MDAQWVEDVPIIDLRAYSETGEIHTSGNSVKLRARLDRANGHHDNQITWTWNNAVPIVGVAAAARHRAPVVPAPRPVAGPDRGRQAADITKARKVALNKPRDAVDACFVASAAAPAPGVQAPPSASQKITDPSQCNTLYPSTSLTRPAAGAPATDDVIQCAQSPIDPEDYLPAQLTDAELDALRAIFPRGVCDYGKRGVGQQDAIPWTSFKDGPGGKPLGPRPLSAPFSPAVKVTRRCDRVRIRVRKGVRVRSITATVDGRRVRRVRAPRRSLSLALAGPARLLVKVVVVHEGRRVTLRTLRTLRAC